MQKVMREKNTYKVKPFFAVAAVVPIREQSRKWPNVGALAMVPHSPTYGKVLPTPSQYFHHGQYLS
jgi:hypothetical protein